jgi:hypothetical protein
MVRGVCRHSTSRPRLGRTQQTPQQLRRSSSAANNEAEVGSQSTKSGSQSSPKQPRSETLFKMFESAATTFASLVVLGFAGWSYHRYYKWLVLNKMEKAFRPGDPALEVAGTSSKMDEEDTIATGIADEYIAHWSLRPEQERLDAIVGGHERGRYYLLIGEKGTGKSSMLLEAMRKIDGEGISMFEAHADTEIFRIRLGKALDYEYHEDYIGSLFSIRGPRDTTALLDIERAFNKLEKIALQRRTKHNKGPLILIVNGVHLIRDDEDGRNLLELMQQRAERWAASNLLTMIFNSDDYWVYDRLKRYATRMEVMPILDLPRDRALTALTQYRHRYFPGEQLQPSLLAQVYSRVGGRLTFLNRVAKAPDMLAACEEICDAEKTWFLSKCGILGSAMDDDVIDQQKFASAAMVLAKALVDKEKETSDATIDPSAVHVLPQIPLHLARQIMTRADFIQLYDAENIFTIDSGANVRADSVAMMSAFREICAEEGFDQFLRDTLDRIAAIESIGRTRELTLKDLWTEQRGDHRAKYEIVTKDNKGKVTGRVEFGVKAGDTEKDN